MSWVRDKWVSVWIEGGSFSVEPAADYLREATMDCLADRAPKKRVIGFFEKMEDGLAFNRMVKRERRKVGGNLNDSMKRGR